MASNDESPEAERATTVDTPPAPAVRPPVPGQAADRWIPVEITAPEPDKGPKSPHKPRHAAPEPSNAFGPRPAVGGTVGRPPVGDASGPPRPPLGDVIESRQRPLDARRERFAHMRARPGIRFLLPGVLVAVVLAAAGVVGVAGAVVIPGASKTQADPSRSVQAPAGTNGAPGLTGAPATGEAPQPETPSGSSTFSPPPGTHERPADVYGAWAGSRSVRLDIPVVALQAYAYAEAVTVRSYPKCHLTWTTLAGIAKVESDHGRANGSVLQDDGRSVPPIIGPPLDGQNGRQAIADTDQGALDNDRTWDRAVGPMQFLPSTWRAYGLDADNDGVIDINNINDAALTAAAFLCANNRDLSTLDGWNAAIHAYNVPEEYRAAVFNATNEYGRRDRQG
ncbi:lytic murein transglycosylase [Dactylosporangium sp. NPDC048998]|uniref:lytic transglycosylase domain-containing protein n=1 Tax=Dactylosporangium sp. NPDC048998 TaxID=3363976 RepID=UPI003722B1B6